MPLFVDAWAPWCHTCLSMRAYVFPDPALRAYRKRFVWLAIDTEKPSGAAFLAKYPMSVWPTLWVVDAAHERAVLEWPGAVTAGELGALLDDAEGAIAHGGEGATRAAAALVRGMQANAAGDAPRAIAELEAAIAAAPAGWSKRGQAADALVATRWKTRDYAACADTAAREIPTLARGTALSDVVYFGLTCTAALPKDAPGRARLPELVAAAKRLATDDALPILADNRSDLFDEVVSTLEGEGDKAGARDVARAWAAFLEREALRAPTKEGRAVFDAHRLTAYMTLGQAERALPMLLESERDFPRDYNPPARLAAAYLALGRLDEARAAIDRGLARVYGPRELRLRAVQADVLLALHDTAAARRGLTEGLAHTGGLALKPSDVRLRDGLAAKLRAIDERSSP